MSQIVRVDASSILRTVPFENGFHFCKEGGLYTNVTATNLVDFANELDEIDVDSVEFHYPRGDFQFWITKILGDEKLGDRMCFVDINLHGNQLRQKLSSIVRERIKELDEYIEHSKIGS
jgi:hypothetical protein